MRLLTCANDVHRTKMPLNWATRQFYDVKWPWLWRRHLNHLAGGRYIRRGLRESGLFADRSTRVVVIFEEHTTAR